MNPLGFALAGAVMLTTSLAAFDSFGQDRSTATVEIVRSEQISTAAPVQPMAAAEAPRRPVRVILSSPYGRQG